MYIKNAVSKSGERVKRLLIYAHRSLRVFLLATCLAGMAQATEPVYLNTEDGAQRLMHADLSSPYFMMGPYIDTQENGGFCGPASMVGALNSLPEISRPMASQYAPYRYFTQRNLFNTESSKVKSYAAVARSGFTLQQASDFLFKLGIQNQIYWGSNLTEDLLRNLIIDTLRHPEQRAIADFNRSTFHQEGAGHYSPIGSYDKATDSVLILDVAKFKYPPFWVTVADLLRSLQTVDSDSGRSRGLIVITGANQSTTSVRTLTR